MAASGRKKFANSNLNTLLGAPKESAKANYGPSVRSGGVVKPVAKPKGLVSLGKAPASSTVSARKGAAWNQLEEEAKKRAEEESAKKHDDSRPDWVAQQENEADEHEVEEELSENEPQGDEAPEEAPKAEPVRVETRPPPPSVPPPPLPAAPVPPVSVLPAPEPVVPPVHVREAPSIKVATKNSKVLEDDDDKANSEGEGEGSEGDEVPPEHGVLDVMVPRTALVINISHVLKHLNGCCSLNQLTKQLRSFKEKTGMSLEDFLRANPGTFRLEGRIVFLLDRDGEKWVPPKKQENPVGTENSGQEELATGFPKGAAWNQLEEEAQKRAEEESAKKHDDSRPDWVAQQENEADEHEYEVEEELSENEPQGDEAPEEAQKAEPVRVETRLFNWTRPPPPSVPPPHLLPAAPVPPVSVLPAPEPVVPPVHVREAPPIKVATKNSKVLEDEDDEANSEGEGSEGDEVPPEHAVLDLMVPRTALVINISHVLKRLNGCCSLNQLTKQIRSFKEKTGMSLEAFLRANPGTFKLEGRIVFLLDRDGEKWVPPKKQENPVGGDGNKRTGKGKGKGEGKTRGGESRENRGKAGGHKGDPRNAKGESRKGAKGKSNGEWRTGNGGQWSNGWDEWDDWKDDWKDGWKASSWKGW